MILGKGHTPILLYVLVIIVLVSITFSYYWVSARKPAVPAAAPLHDNKK